MLWLRPLTMLRLLALLTLCETVRTGLFVSALPVSGPGLGLSAAVIGVMAGAHYLADALAKGPGGLLVQRWGLGAALLPGPLLGLLALLVTRYWPHPASGVLACAAWGLGYAALWPGIMSASQALAVPGRTARALTVSNLSVAPAILTGALIVGPLMTTHPDATWNALLAAQVLAAGLALSLARLRLPAPDAPPGPAWRDWQRVAALLPAAFVQTLAPALLSTVLYPLLRHLNLSLRDLLLPGALALTTFALSVWLIGRRADRGHPRRALLPGLLLLAVTFALAAVPGMTALLLPLGALIGLGYGAFITGWNGLVARTLPEGQQAAAWGTVMAVEALGYAVGPVLGGVAWQLAGVTGVFGLGAAAFLGALLYDLTRHRTRRAAATRPA
ncbi:MFS transporter [Deinococcus knuensis]|uniref:MFS transporter n=1 Tax=Deinococcus knuensis TaxID=1837380 RepID=A0ABQ2SY90_9DEIO|nr:MFS transporter [Deinococcus knuensis]GGS42149.1 MFS transporter [Deinococcus knuensis]